MQLNTTSFVPEGLLRSLQSEQNRLRDVRDTQEVKPALRTVVDVACEVSIQSSDISYYSCVCVIHSFFLPLQEKLALQRKAVELEDELKVQI
jgi:hypothetical protein